MLCTVFLKYKSCKIVDPPVVIIFITAGNPQEIGYWLFKCSDDAVMNFFMKQITAASVRLVNCETKKLESEWRAKSGKNISVASCNAYQIVCAVGSELFYLEINAAELKEVR